MGRVMSCPAQILFVLDALRFHSGGKHGQRPATRYISQSKSLSMSKFPMFGWIFDSLPKRYSGDIPQGTAIPHWAFYNVTVRDYHPAV